MVTRVDEHWLEDNQRELGQVYNRLQESHQIIGELVELLEDVYPELSFNTGGSRLAHQVDSAINKYGDINGD